MKKQTLKDLFTWIKILTVVGVIISLCGLCDHKCTEVSEQACQEQKHESSAAGVTVRGFDCWGWVKNNNNFSVRIRKVYARNWGEQSRWVETFTPSEKYKIYVERHNAFYIYDMEGVIIGYIQPRYNPTEKREK